MTSIIISAEDHEVGDKVASQVAMSLGYKHVGPSLLKEIAPVCETT